MPGDNCRTVSQAMWKPPLPEEGDAEPLSHTRARALMRPPRRLHERPSAVEGPAQEGTSPISKTPGSHHPAGKARRQGSAPDAQQRHEAPSQGSQGCGIWPQPNTGIRVPGHWTANVTHLPSMSENSRVH